MPHVAIEAVILAPLLVIQIMLFPFMANTISSGWANSARDIALNETGSQIANTIQQLYLSLNRADFLPGTIVHASTFPKEIGAHVYTVTGLLTTPVLNSSRILLLNLTVQELRNTVVVQTPLGPNALWNENSLFISSSLGASIKAQKFANGTLLFSF